MKSEEDLEILEQQVEESKEQVEGLKPKLETKQKLFQT